MLTVFNLAAALNDWRTVYLGSLLCQVQRLLCWDDLWRGMASMPWQSAFIEICWLEYVTTPASSGKIRVKSGSK